MKLSFGNMTLEMNIFNIYKQPGDDNDLQEVNFIEKPTLEPCQKDDEFISEGKTDSPPALPFPHAMTKQRKVNHNSKIFETFK